MFKQENLKFPFDLEVEQFFSIARSIDFTDVGVHKTSRLVEKFK